MDVVGIGHRPKESSYYFAKLPKPNAAQRILVEFNEPEIDLIHFWMSSLTTGWSAYFTTTVLVMWLRAHLWHGTLTATRTHRKFWRRTA